MIRVLIVDDEPKLREGLRSLIDWESQGYTVVATAANGFDALEKFAVHHPELVVADIRMPGMDGLELIGELRGRGSECHVLILSGYADFEYAKQAIQYRIDGYLLKPVDEDEMNNYLVQIRAKIEQEGRFSQWSEEEPARRREALLRDLLAVPEDRREDGQSRQAAEALGLKQSCEVVLIEPYNAGSGREGGAEAGLMDAMSLLERRFTQLDGHVFAQAPYLGVVLERPLASEADCDQLYRELSGALHETGIAFSAAAGGEAPADEAYRSLSGARELLRERFFWQRDKLLSRAFPAMERPAAHGSEMGLNEGEERLLLAVEAGSVDAVRPMISRISGLLVAEGADETRVREAFVRIVSSVLLRLEPAYPEARSYTAEYAAPIGELYRSRYLSELEEQAAGFLAGLASRLYAGRGNEVRKIIGLMQLRYNENLKLETLAELLNYNSAYLGKLFKTTTGEYFNTYLDKVRIEKAKELLAEGMKVYEVAEKVGYMNPDYFNAKFRKYVGVSPTSFRKNK